MSDYHVAIREQQILWNIALDMYIGRLLAKLNWISVTANSKYQVDWFLLKTFQYS